MNQGRLHRQWEQVSHLLAMMVNTAAFRKGPPVEASAFNPFATDAVQWEPIPRSEIREIIARHKKPCPSKSN